MELDKLTLGELKEVKRLLVGSTCLDKEHPYKIGKNYFIRTVTMYYTGKLVAVYEHELVLEDAAWISDTGRFSDALANASLNEVEPFPAGQVVIGRGAVIDASIWNGELPRKKK